MIVKIGEIVLFTRATPGSSLVLNNLVKIGQVFFLNPYLTSEVSSIDLTFLHKMGF